MTATTTALRDHAPRELPAPAPEAAAAPATPARPGFRQRRSTQVFAGLVALATVGALGAWVFGRGKESTDDAQVEGRVASVSPRVSGQVEKVLVIDNQSVKQGDLLVQLDTRDLDAKLASARADLESARAGLASAQVNLKLTQANVDASLRQARGGLTQASSSVQATRSSLAQARAEVAAAEAADRLAQADWVRAQELAKAEAISRADVDARRARSEQAQAALEQARAKLSSTEANLTSSGGGLTTAQGRLAAAETAPDQVKACRSRGPGRTGPGGPGPGGVRPRRAQPQLRRDPRPDRRRGEPPHRGAGPARLAGPSDAGAGPAPGHLGGGQLQGGPDWRDAPGAEGHRPRRHLRPA